jgi:hypothetical protein
VEPGSQLHSRPPRQRLPSSLAIESVSASLETPQRSKHQRTSVQLENGALVERSDVNVSARTCEPAAVLGYNFWQRQLGGDPAVIGRSLQVEGVRFTIVGIAPKGFTGLGLVSEPDVTIPIVAEPASTASRPPPTSTIRSRVG